MGVFVAASDTGEALLGREGLRGQDDRAEWRIACKRASFGTSCESPEFGDRFRGQLGCGALPVRQRG
jgi:hypothetical protein